LQYAIELSNVKWEKTMKFRSTCPVASTLDLVGDKWTLLIIRDLLLGKAYFDEFLQSREGIASNILANRLKALADHGLVKASPDKTDRRRIRYQLTRRGEEYRSLVRLLSQWGLEHVPGTVAETANKL
jgi:DNA-binding HxlR family transcriptional regulator